VAVEEAEQRKRTLLLVYRNISRKAKGSRGGFYQEAGTKTQQTKSCKVQQKENQLFRSLLKTWFNVDLQKLLKRTIKKRGDKL